MRPDPDSDDDALRWDGDDDPTLAPGWKTVGKAVPLADAGAAEPADDGAADEEAGGSSDEDAPAQTGSAVLIALGVLGGVYLLYTIGWLITAVRTSAPGTSVVSDAMYSLGLWLAVLAAPCWFALALRGTTTTRSRFLWLVAGAVVLVPLPFVLGVTA
ncbi:DNA polymerase III subunit gamma/tau [Agromyces sp. NPDC127015]|jgi:hypothetical protein|uniref:DNA polymerase III subunit gamma/tau n=1 Tax=Agromyces sp. NPDC127015 TaxID=3347108 RepID=UPI003652E895